MHLFLRVLIVALTLFLLTTLGHAQKPELEDWLALPSDEAGLVLVINGDVSLVTISDELKRPLDVKKWAFGTPFVQQYRMNPGTYQIYLGGLISSIGVVTKSGALTYLRLTPSLGMADEIGTSVVATTGRMPPEIIDLAQIAQKKGIPDAFKASFIKSDAHILVLNTDPPWPIPPPPKR